MLERYERFVAPSAALVDVAAQERIGDAVGAHPASRAALRGPRAGGGGPAGLDGRLRRRRRVRGSLPHATLAVVDDAGHALPHEQPALLRALVAEWLTRVDARGALTEVSPSRSGPASARNCSSVPAGRPVTRSTTSVTPREDAGPHPPEREHGSSRSKPSDSGHGLLDGLLAVDHRAPDGAAEQLRRPRQRQRLRPGELVHLPGVAVVQQRPGGHRGDVAGVDPGDARPAARRRAARRRPRPGRGSSGGR